jgi:hypothetical protein
MRWWNIGAGAYGRGMSSAGKSWSKAGVVCPRPGHDPQPNIHQHCDDIKPDLANRSFCAGSYGEASHPLEVTPAVCHGLDSSRAWPARKLRSAAVGASDAAIS